MTQDFINLDAFMRDYIPKAGPFLAKHGGEVLVASFDAEPLEGSPAKGAVVIRFPSRRAIHDFENDPGYAPVKKIRHDLTTHANAVMAPAFRPPS